MNDIRFKTERRKFTRFQRLRIWWNGVLNAVRKVPDTHYSNYVRVEKGDEGYEDAMWSFTEVGTPARYTFKNGQWEKSEPKPSESNPNWCNPQ